MWPRCRRRQPRWAASRRAPSSVPELALFVGELSAEPHRMRNKADPHVRRDFTFDLCCALGAVALDQQALVAMLGDDLASSAVYGYDEVAVRVPAQIVAPVRPVPVV